MSLVEINWSPTSRQLRQFGVISATACPLLGWLGSVTTNQLLSLTLVGATVAGLAWVWPAAIRPLFVALTALTIPIGIVVAELALLAIYFGVFLPIGLVFRLVGRDALQLKIDRNATSYWQEKSQPKDAASYYRKF